STSKPARFALPAEATNASTVCRISSFDISFGVCQVGLNGSGDGATVGHGDSPRPRASRPSQGTWVEALRPAWPIWIPIGFLETVRQCARTRAMEASLWSL